MEFTKQIHLSDNELTLVDMHSALNLLNILTYEVLSLAGRIGGEEALQPSLSLIQDISSTLSDRAKTMEHIARITESKKRILENVTEAASGSENGISESLNNIKTLLNVLEVRAAEIIAREKSLSSWIPHSVRVLKERLHEVFSAFEQNSKGRYAIVYDESEHDEHSYLILIKILGKAKENDSICMPPEFQDVTRDLIANARKYSDPGSRIEALLSEDDGELFLSVRDTGWGIPEAQLEFCIDYGYRAKNVADKKSYGGGFGLTKAYYVAKKYHGRMWIESELERGTEVTIRIPIPRSACT